jgi:type IV pilus biogenesis protein CpaD/CtpE
VRPVLLAVLAALLAGCPEERPGAERQIPGERVPPAVSVDPAPAPDGGAPPPAGAGARR